MTYIFSNGDVADGSHVNDNFNKLNKLTNEKAINDVSATNSGVLAGSSQVIIDKFTDTSGINNTVNTGSTTGTLANDSYTCAYTLSSSGSAATQTAESNYTAGTTLNSSLGMKILANSNCTIVSFTKDSDSAATHAYVRRTSGEILATATFSGSTATFSPEVQLIGGQYYLVECDKNGASCAHSYNLSNNLPATNTLINFICKSINGAADSSILVGYNILSISAKSSTLAFTDSIVQSAVVTIPTGMTKVFVTPLMYEALSGSDNITADVSIDNGAHYTTGVPINTWTPITSANGTQLIVKANLLTGSGVSTPKISGWRVLME